MNHRTNLLRLPKYPSRFRAGIIALLLAFFQAIAPGQEPKTNAPPREGELWLVLVSQFERQVSNLQSNVTAQSREIQDLKSRPVAFPNIPVPTAWVLSLVLFLFTGYLLYRSGQDAELKVKELSAKAPFEIASLLLKAVSPAKQTNPGSVKEIAELRAALQNIQAQLDAIQQFVLQFEESRKNQ